MTFDTFVGVAIDYAMAHREQRFGQALMNALSYNRPDLSAAVVDIWECDNPQAPIIYSFFYELEQMW